MEQSGLVQRIEDGGQDDAEAQHVGGGEWTASRQPVGQRAASQILLDEQRTAVPRLGAKDQGQGFRG